MKKFLVIAVLSLLLVKENAYATIINCSVNKAFKCGSEGCTELNSEILINIDTKEETYKRTDRIGTKTYDLHIYKVGNYVIAEVGESTIFKMDNENNKSFVETTYIGLATYNNFGICKFN